MTAGASSDIEANVDPRIGPGAVVLVVGPSGAGKDALLSRVRSMLARDDGIHFPERVVSRPAHASEAFASVAPEVFETLQSAGEFALHWRAHGLGYGLPRTMDDAVRSGGTVVLNGSRAIVEDARRRYANVVVVLIDAPAEVRARRLLARGRESGAEIARRLERSADGFDPHTADRVIDNSGDIARAVEDLLAAILDVTARCGTGET